MRAILTPLDGSRLAEESLRAACATARRSAAVLHMALVHHPVVAGGDGAAMAPAFDDLDRLAREGEERYLEQVAERMRDAHGIRVETAILDGPVAETLEGYVERIGAGLVVMTTHGRGVVSRFWLGSVADHLLRHLEVPLLLLRHHEHPAVDSRMAFRRMLVPLDGSARSESVLEPALGALPAADRRVRPGAGPARRIGERRARSRTRGGLSRRGRGPVGAPGVPREHDGGGVGVDRPRRSSSRGGRRPPIASPWPRAARPACGDSWWAA